MCDQNKSDQVKNQKRRLNKECNYSVFTTLLMRFLKENGLYKISQNMAKANEIQGEKNYYIIFLRIALYLFEMDKKRVEGQDPVNKIFGWLENQIDDCVSNKYKENSESFRKSVRNRSKELLVIFKNVFEERYCGDQQKLKNLVIKIYQKKGKSYSLPNKKNSNKLTRIILGVLKFGENFCLKEKGKTGAEHSDNSFEGMCANEQLILSTDNCLDLESLCQVQEWDYGVFDRSEGRKEPLALLDLISPDLAEELGVMEEQSDFSFEG